MASPAVLLAPSLTHKDPAPPIEGHRAHGRTFHGRHFEKRPRLNAAADKALSQAKETLNAIDPRLETLNRKLSRFTKMCKVEAAQSIYRQILFENLKPDVYTFTCLQNLYIRVGNLPLARFVFDSMKVVSVKPDVIAYNCLMKGYLSLGQFEEVWKLIDEMLAAGLMPDANTMNPVIAASYNKCGGINGAWSVFEKMQEKGIAHNQEIIRCLFQLCLKAEDAEKLMITYKVMREMNIKPTKLFYGKIIDLLLSKHRWAEAKQVFHYSAYYNTLTKRVLLVDTTRISIDCTGMQSGFAYILVSNVADKHLKKQPMTVITNLPLKNILVGYLAQYNWELQIEEDKQNPCILHIKK